MMNGENFKEQDVIVLFFDIFYFINKSFVVEYNYI